MIELISLKFTGLIADHLLTIAYTAKSQTDHNAFYLLDKAAKESGNKSKAR